MIRKKLLKLVKVSRWHQISTLELNLIKALKQTNKVYILKDPKFQQANTKSRE